MKSSLFDLFGEAVMRKFFGNHITILGFWLGSSGLLVILMTLGGVHS